MDIGDANRKAWNNEVRRRNFWTLIASEEQIAQARAGKPNFWISPFKYVPLDWISDLRGQEVLIACGGGGQQTPILSAYGCKVTTIDVSDFQIEQDRLALERYGLSAKLVCSDVLKMPFEDHSFRAVILPQAMNFIEDIDKLYTEVRRVLMPKGRFIFGTANPILYIFDQRIQEHRLKIRYTIPFSHTSSFSKKDLERRIQSEDTLEFSHTLDGVIGGLLDKGFFIDGFYTDDCGSELTDSFIHDAHLAIKAELKD